MIDLLGKRYYFFAFSLLLIIPGFVVILLLGFPLAVDFTGGTMMEIEFEFRDRSTTCADRLALRRYGD